MSEDIDIQITRKEAELSSFFTRMEKLKNEFIKETVHFASEWYKTTTKEYLTNFSEVTLDMEEEQIAQMKAQINELIGETEKIVKGELHDAALWWHQRPRLHDPIDQYLQVADKYPIIIDREVRHVLGRLGLILEKFNYHVAASGNTGSYQEFWFDYPTGAVSNSTPYYPHLLKWSEDMQDTIRDYNSEYLKSLAIFSEIQRLKEEKKKQQAMNRWDSI